MRAHHDFWAEHPGFVWSNPEAGDAAHIRAALVRPRYRVLLDIAVEFGIERLRCEWAELQADATPEVARAHPSVERMLGHIEEGFALAAAGH
jgi:hypothetical protein